VVDCAPVLADITTVPEFAKDSVAACSAVRVKVVLTATVGAAATKSTVEVMLERSVFAATFPVIETVPPDIVLPATTEAAEVKVIPDPTVTLAVPRLPVNVPLALKAAVCVVEVIPERSAASEVLRSVTAVVPEPSIVWPVTLATSAVKVLPEATVVVNDVPRFPVNVTSPSTAAVFVPVTVILDKSAAASPSNAVILTRPVPVIVSPSNTAAVPVIVTAFTTKDVTSDLMLVVAVPDAGVIK
jgi:hypothetical protein